MKISKITIKQLFGIKEWQGDGKNIELVGDNGTGKTSVIDAIRYALTNSSDREFIVKNGETEGEIYIETDNGLSIDRKARTAMAQLEERIKALREKKDGLAGVKADKVKVIQSEYEATVSKYEAEQASYAEYADMETTPIDDLMAKANETEKMKGHINEWRRMLNIQKEVDELQSESNSLTEKIELARTLPGTILETAEIPIEGLTVKDGIPLINGLPVSNLSEGEKLDLCIDVAIQNPAGLQIILIDGTEKLSEENRTRLYEKCKKKGLQFIATRTTSNNELTVIEL